MLRIRLTRVGKKKQPHYRVVVADIEAPRDGRIVERIGYYSPLTESDLVDIDEARALYWLSVGAQPTDTVRSLLRKQGTLERLARLHAGEPMETLVTEYKVATGQVEAEAAPAKTAAAAAKAPVAEETAVAEETVVTEEETVVEEPATEVGEAYTEAGAEETAAEEESAIDEATETVSEAVDSAATVVSDAAGEAVDAVADAADAAANAVADATEAVTASDEEE